ncbi:GDSL esterase/lipase At1g29670-like [Vicia villosa]|uniref:GDSL esterase/lipase At1g29670-like n=1 Tax=Vicia villosa TaxID=3911 RepID=UPI00273CBFB4|nr:GDSL esterase/lipase At1g29670-like [Vicia villosa]
MACKTKTCLGFHLFLLVACYMQHFVGGSSPKVRCLFIFGDSFSDSGNNNYIPTTAKANYSPYGIDFPRGPTGRDNNGKTEIDIIGERLGLKKFIPPFANILGSNILQGVNYASASAGIRNETGKRTAGTNIAYGQQIENHKTIVAQIAAKLGGVKNAKKYLKKCLYYIYIGTNDYALNYFQSNLYPTSRMYNPKEYAKVLIDQYSAYGKVLYNLGARKFVAVGLGKIGCTPMVLANSSVNGPCVEELNDIEAIFSHKLRSLVDKINTKYPDSKTIFRNTTAIILDGSRGFTVLNASCCPMKKSNGFCIPDSTPCPNRSEYVYFDGIHPTEAANKYTASLSYDSTNNPKITYPMDIKHLAHLRIKIRKNYICVPK